MWKKIVGGVFYIVSKPLEWNFQEYLKGPGLLFHKYTQNYSQKNMNR